MSPFVHLHNHSHFSLLDGACRIKDLVKTALEYEMPALALTDHGNLFGAIEFYKTAKEQGLKPIIGSEVYVAPSDHRDKQASDRVAATAYHLVLLCKNHRGYQNLIKLSSIGYLEGFYYKPRIDHKLLQEHSEGLIALSACLKGEVAFKLMKQGKMQALAAIDFYRDIFGDDFYLEVQNHGIAEEDTVREAIFSIAAEHHLQVVATNDIHYIKREHWAAHDVLLCLQTGKDFHDPNRMRYNTQELYFKNSDEMAQLFPDHPELLSNTLTVADKCDLQMDFSKIFLPAYQIPDDQETMTLDDYLAKLAGAGMVERYQTITPELQERLDHELQIIKQMNFAGYFLITSDFIRFARSKNIPVGPGRGSAAGSLVSYCLGITSLDPIAYELYFERFLNPERISMPDIDIDFCYERRGEVIEYVKNKYGHKNVCQIITFGTMAARAVIRDVGRVLKMGYSDVDKIAKLVPPQLKITLEKALETVAELRELENKDDQHKQLIEYSKVLEGLARHASTHAAGVVITPSELTEYVPLFKTKEGDVTTQYDKNILETVGLLKMDFLGLRTLTVIQKAVENIRKRGIALDIDKIPLDDPKVYKIFSDGRTVGIFQFESSGMRDYLRKLQPEKIDDLIAMNALYRPGPMEMIDHFIDCKKGRVAIHYSHSSLKNVLEPTYGVIVYQEQVMRIANELAGYSMGEADVLRRAMGKKKPEEMAKQRSSFITGATKRGVSQKVAEEVFALMEKFAEYGFNKSHSACYAYIAYQTAYLKTYYPAEFMAATISSEMNNSDRVTIYIEECRSMGIRVLPPDVNESFADFVVTEQGIRFGLGAVKNVGRSAIHEIVTARNEKGRFKTIFDLTMRVKSSAVNRKVLESLIEAGALDSLEGTRAQLFAAVETALEFGQKPRSAINLAQTSMFGDEVETKMLQIPELPVAEEWSKNTTLKRENTVLGFFLSGHPLDHFRDEIRTFSTVSLDATDSLKDGSMVRFCGMFSDLKIHYDRKNRPMAFCKFEDFTSSIEAVAFADTFEKFRALIFVESMVMLIGKINTREGESAKIIIDQVVNLAEVRQRFAKNLCLAFDLARIDPITLHEVKTVLQDHEGDIPVYINVKSLQKGDLILFSRSLKVKPSAELLECLRSKIGSENVWVGA